MSHVQNTPSYTGQEILSILAGWQPGALPVHRALEREAVELQDLIERDHAARATSARRAAR